MRLLWLASHRGRGPSRRGRASSSRHLGSDGGHRKCFGLYFKKAFEGTVKQNVSEVYDWWMVEGGITWRG